MARGRIAKKTKTNILRILKVLKDAHKEEEMLTVCRIAKKTGIHKWSVSRILDLYMPYVSVKIIEELDSLGLSAKIVQLDKPEITDLQALRVLSIRV
jgi:hypothetical protein